ncbi:hypothetical protein [Gallaecimonas pentaromativorans]|uniref:hypothetical protein n=1 Tax=Gallaecimonas pentaromativorans TaxID=584787 RepID=UPI003A8F04F6
MADFPVKWFSSYMGGSTILGDNTAGDFISLLKACLITGFNTKPVTELSFDSSTGVATAELGSGHGFLKAQVISVSGADQAEYNGEWRVTGISSTSVKYSPDISPSVAVATGSLIEVKAAPQGQWEVAAEDAASNKLALRSIASYATDHVLVVTNDGMTGPTGTENFSHMECVSNFVDIETYDVECDLYWPVSHGGFSDSETEGADNPDWLLVADGGAMFFIPTYTRRNRRSCMVAGLIKSVRPGDAHNFILNGVPISGRWNTTNQNCLSDFASGVTTDFVTVRPNGYKDSNGPAYRQLARANSQMPGATTWGMLLMGEQFSAYDPDEDERGDTAITFPNPADNGFYVASNELPVIEPGCVRGTMPGVVQPLNGSPAYIGEVVTDLPSFDGEPVIFWTAAAWQYNASSGTPYQMFDKMIGFRLDGWR